MNKRVEEVKRERRRRQDTGPMAGLKLNVPEELKEAGFEYRWINDDDRRIHAKTVEDDWDVVKTAAIEGTGEGAPVSRVVGKGPAGQPIRAILCRKPTEFYKEDKAKELQAVKEREDAIKRGAPTTPEGLSGPTAYIPDRHEGHSTGAGVNRIGAPYKP